MTIKGDPDREAVLVTDSKTYALKFVETSNLQLLLPPDQVCIAAQRTVTSACLLLRPPVPTFRQRLACVGARTRRLVWSTWMRIKRMVREH